MTLLEITINSDTVAYAIVITAFAAVGFFLKQLHSDIKETIRQRAADREEIGKLKGTIELNKQNADLHIENLNKNIDAVRSDLRTINKELKEHHKELMEVLSKPDK